jgi:putative intracellular protease/amidase
MNFYFLLFDKFETLDLFGPVEIFGRIPDARLNYISMKGGIITSAQGTQILTQKAAKLSDDAVLVIPGGRGTRPLVKDADFLAGLRDLADSAANVLSICMGSALLAAAGILVNVKATSNKYAFEWVTSTGDAVWIRKAR